MFDIILREYIRHNIFFFEMLLSYLPFIPCFKPRSKLWLRLPLCLVASFCFSHFVPLHFAGMSQAGWLAYSIFWYTAVAATLAVSLKICCKGTWWNAIFFGISAYAVQHVFFRIKFSYEYIYRLNGINIEWLNYVSYWAAMAATLVGCYFLFTRRFVLEPNFKVNNRKMVVVGLLLIAIAVGMNQIIASATRNYRDISPEMFVAVTVLGTICCLVTLDSMFGNAYNRRTEEEARMIRQLWQNDRKQYELSKQNIELLNMKFHDLKYRLSAASVTDAIAKSDETADVKRALAVYDSLVKTNNETLDVVLTEKSLQCDKLGIRLACMADGSLLNGMNPVDIYSLFGNALDNAIESLKSVEDNEKKLINLSLLRVGNMAKLRIDNYVDNEPKIVGGFPQTTKPDKLNHGFGLKSMKHTVEKYNGGLQFSVSDHMFTLEGLIPVR